MPLDTKAKKLGSYDVPYTNSVLDKKTEKGSAKLGLQKDFYEAVTYFVNTVKDMGCSIDMSGVRGYLSPDDMQKLIKAGKTNYRELQQYYRWGLAWDINARVITDKDWKNEQEKEYDKLLEECGLSIKSAGAAQGTIWKKYGATKDGRTKQQYVFVPKYFKQDEEISRVKYTPSVADSDEDDESNLSAGSVSGGTGDGSSRGSSSASFAEGAYFFQNMFGNIENQAGAELLKGDRALANDEALWGSVKAAVNTSMRSCMSAPDGSFIAWYPDYWGLVDDTPTLVLEDIEMIDLNITHSDDTFYTHVFTPGVTSSGVGIEYMMTQGVVSIESGMAAATSEAITSKEGVSIASTEPSKLLSKLINIPDGEGWKYSPAELYRRYGARPLKSPQTTLLAGVTELIEADEGEEGSGNEMTENFDSNPKYIMPFLNALYEFMSQWSQQYKANLTMTFQPGLFPGARIKVKSLDISFYVSQVIHNMDYSNGFQTNATCICPVGSLLPGMVNPNKVSPNFKPSGGNNKKKKDSDFAGVSTTKRS